MDFVFKAACIVSQIMSKYDQTWILKTKKKLAAEEKKNALFNFTELICLTSAPVQQSQRELQRERQGTEK